MLVGSSTFPCFSDAADSLVRSLLRAERGTVEGADHGWLAADLAERIAAHVLRPPG